MNTQVVVREQSPSSALWGGLFCCAIVCVVALIPGVGIFVSLLLAVPLLLASFILSIVAMSRGGVIGGVILLLLTVVAAPFLMITGAAVSNGAALAWLGHAAAPTPRQTPASLLADDTATPTPAFVRAAATPAARLFTPSPRAFASVQDAQREAIRLYPDLARTGSPLNARFAAAYKEKAASAPEYLRENDWPVRLAHEVAGQ